MSDRSHETVLLEEAVEALSVAPADAVVDATIGGAGHFASLAASLGPEGVLIGIDADEEAIARAQEAAAGVAARVVLANDNFRNLARILDEAGVESLDKALFDLGWSGYQLARGRGFSFRADEPLLMTYGSPDEGVTARDLVNTLEEGALADLIYTLGEERFSRGIARAIVRAREEAPIETTLALAAAVEAGVPGWYARRRIHPATKTFQALRIAVNDELGALREGLAAALDRLSAGGRIAVITFHSLEDRIVKGMFRDAAHAGKGAVLTKKPLAPSSAELARNPRARSAKLRVFERADGSRSFISTHSFVAYA